MKTILSSLVNVLPYSWLWHSAALEFSVTVFCWFIAQPLLKATKKAFLLFTLLEKRRKTAICICSSPFYTFSCKAEIHYGIGSKHFFVCEQNTVKSQAVDRATILDPFGQRSQYISIQFPLRKLKVLGCATNWNVLLLATLQ